VEPEDRLLADVVTNWRYSAAGGPRAECWTQLPSSRPIYSETYLSAAAISASRIGFHSE
jgi:hypothetical protein